MLKGVWKVRRFSFLLVLAVGVLALSLGYRGGAAPTRAQPAPFSGFPPSLTANFSMTGLTGPLAVSGFTFAGPMSISFQPGPNGAASIGDFTFNIQNAVTGSMITGSGSVRGQ